MTVASIVVARILSSAIVMIFWERTVKSASLPASRDPRVASVKDAYAGSMVMPENKFIKNSRIRYEDKLPLSASWRVSRCSGNLCNFLMRWKLELGIMINTIHQAHVENYHQETCVRQQHRKQTVDLSIRRENQNQEWSLRRYQWATGTHTNVWHALGPTKMWWTALDIKKRTNKPILSIPHVTDSVGKA